MASSARVTPQIQADRLMALGTSPAGPVYLHIAKLGARVETQAKQNVSGTMVKVRTGNLRSSGHTVMSVRGTKLVNQVIFDAEYALAVHDGSKAHDVVPVGKKVLAWKSATGPAFAMRAHIPAQVGRPFLVDALTVINE